MTLHITPGQDCTINPIVIDDSKRSAKNPSMEDPKICLKCTYPEGGICAQEDFCKGCGNFDAFWNSCTLTHYRTSIQGKKVWIAPKTNASRWLLAIVGCASDTRRQHP